MLAYDIKAIMNKGEYDIIKPEWILDSIAKGELVPMRKKCVPLKTDSHYHAGKYRLHVLRYFFHATATRTEDEAYDLEEPEEEPIPSRQSSIQPDDSQPEIPLQTQIEQLNPDLADWFIIDEKKHKAASSGDQDGGGDSETATDSETVTEADSDNDDTRGDEGVQDEDGDDDEWVNVPGGSRISRSATLDSFGFVEAESGHEVSADLTRFSLTATEVQYYECRNIANYISGGQ